MAGDPAGAARSVRGWGGVLRSSDAPRIEPTVAIEPFTNREPPGAAMFARPQLDRALAAPDRSGHSAEFAPRLEQISDFVAADPANARTLDDVVRTRVFPDFMHALLNLNEVGNGWHTTGNRRGFGSDYRFRAIANVGGIWWNSATEVIYHPLQADETGAPPTGDHAYSIRFGPGESPGEHVDGYWSITLYSHPDVRLVPNPDGKYSISYRTDLSPDSDGASPSTSRRSNRPASPTPNWLPSTGPGEAWVLVLRLYLPRPDVLDGSWSPPAMTTVH